MSDRTKSTPLERPPSDVFAAVSKALCGEIASFADQKSVTTQDENDAWTQLLDPPGRPDLEKLWNTMSTGQRSSIDFPAGRVGFTFSWTRGGKNAELEAWSHNKARRTAANMVYLIGADGKVDEIPGGH